jgi:hypothetical protein
MITEKSPSSPYLLDTPNNYSSFAEEIYQKYTKNDNFSKELYEFLILVNKSSELLKENLKRNSIVQYQKIPRYLIKKEVIDYLGKESVFKTLCSDYGLKPIREKHKETLYSSRELEDLCIQFEKNILL